MAAKQPQLGPQTQPGERFPITTDDPSIRYTAYQSIRPDDIPLVRAPDDPKFYITMSRHLMGDEQLKNTLFVKSVIMRNRQLQKPRKNLFGDIIAPLNKDRLRIIQRLKHQNLVHIREASVQELSYGDAKVDFFMEICELGSLANFTSNNPNKGMPMAFAWSMLSDLVKAVCYLQYGYETLKEMHPGTRPKQGWDPVVHTNICGSSRAPNLMLKLSKKMRWPIVVIGGLDHCRTRREFIEMLGAEEGEKKFKWQAISDLYQIVGFMREFLADNMDKQQAKPMADLFDQWFDGIGSNTYGITAKFMARTLKERMMTATNDDFDPQAILPWTNSLTTFFMHSTAIPNRPTNRHYIDVLTSDADIKTDITPRNLTFPKGGFRPPLLTGKLRELFPHSKKEESWDSLDEYYYGGLYTPDAKTTARAHDLDKVLRDIAKSGKERYKFQRIKELGHGSFGTVSLWARVCAHPKYPNTWITQQVAIKDSEYDDWYKDYNAEFYMVRRLMYAKCPYVVKMFDHGSYKNSDNKYFHRTVLEYCNLGDLHRVLNFYKTQQYAVPEPFAWWVIREVAAFLVYCDNGALQKDRQSGWDPILHWDIKPMNVLLHKEPNSKELYPQVKVTDLGLATTLPNETIGKYKSSFVAGTYGFIDPFSFLNAGKKPITPRSDIYSFGVMVDLMIDLMTTMDVNETEFLFNNANELNHPVEQYLPCSPRFIRLSQRCQDPDDSKRPSPWEIYQFADKTFAGERIQAMLRDPWTSEVLFTDEDRKKLDDVPLLESFPYRLKKDWYKDTRNARRVEELQSKVERKMIAAQLHSGGSDDDDDGEDQIGSGDGAGPGSSSYI